jgi:hypothetical protein
MKSFEAKLYIEDNLATIEFDIMMKGKYDVQSSIGWDFGVIRVTFKKKSSVCVLSVYDRDDVKMVGKILSSNHVNVTLQNPPLAREISLKFLDLYMEGKWCLIFNYIYPEGTFDSIDPDSKEVLSFDGPDDIDKDPSLIAVRIPMGKDVHKGNQTYSYIKRSTDMEYELVEVVTEKMSEEQIASLKNTRQSIEQNEIGKPDRPSISRDMLHGLFDKEGKPLD